jgi:glycosyltransferase involved in cell wall biosynthesis
MNRPSPQPPDVAIVVPVLDEAEALPSLLSELSELDLLTHTVFVDNGSRDGSAALIAEAGGAVIEEPRRGYGYACLTGAEEAHRWGNEIVVFMEGDGSDDPAEIGRLVAPIVAGRFDLMIGSRRAAVRRGAHMPLHQRLGEWLTVALMRLLFGLRLCDNGPFRAIRADLLEHLDMEPRGFSWPTEMAVKAHLCGARIGFCETGFRRRRGDSKISGTARGTWAAAVGIFGALLRLRLRAHPAPYRPQ